MKKDSLAIDGKIYLSSKRAAEIAGYSKDYVGQLCREGKLDCRRIDRLWWIDESSIKKHVLESTKLNQTSFGSTRFEQDVLPSPASFAAGSFSVPVGIPGLSLKPRPRAGHYFRKVAIFLSVVAVIFAGGMVAMTTLRTITISSVQNLADAHSVWNYVYDDLISLIWPQAPGNLSYGYDNPSLPHGGLVVVPSEGSTTDAKLEQSIANSFSDNVTVAPGPNDTAGVITPEFRTIKGHDFLYMLVPVKTSSTSNASQ